MNPVRSLARDKVASPEDLGGATSNGMNDERINRIIGVVIIFAIIFFGLFWFSGIKLNKVSNTPTPNKPVNKIENFSDDKISPDFPKTIPIESGVKISSYNATSPDGRVQASVVFQSSKSVAANFKLYKDYLTKNNWKILAKDSSKSDLQLIIAQNSSGILNVTIHQIADLNKSLVDLSFLVNK